jgi:hypothetical protein
MDMRHVQLGVRGCRQQLEGKAMHYRDLES